MTTTTIRFAVSKRRGDLTQVDEAESNYPTFDSYLSNIGDKLEMIRSGGLDAKKKKKKIKT